MRSKLKVLASPTWSVDLTSKTLRTQTETQSVGKISLFTSSRFSIARKKGRSSGTERVFLVAEEEGEKEIEQSTTDTAFTLGIGVETVVDGPCTCYVKFATHPTASP